MKSRYTNLALILVLFLSLLACSRQAVAEEKKASSAVQVRFAGVDDERLIKDLGKVSQLQKGRLRPDASPRQVQWQANQDQVAMIDVLKAAGYFQPTIELDLNMSTNPPVLTFQVKPGELYTVFQLTINFDDESPAETFYASEELDEPLRATAPNVLSLESRILKKYRETGYPFVRLQQRALDINHSSAQVSLQITAVRGSQATYGPITVEGLEKVKESRVLRDVTFKKGDPFNEKQLHDIESALLTSGLFASARCFYKKEAEDDGTLPIIIQLKERKHRTVRLGLEYSSDVGAGVKLGWEHRNLGGRGDRLSANAEVSEIGLEGKIGFNKDKLRYLPFEFQTNIELGDEETDAYDNYAGEFQWLYGYRPFSHFRIVSGAGYRYTRVKQLEEEDDYSLVIVPLLMNWDRRDDVMDPRRGFVLFNSIGWHDDQLSDLHFTTSILVGSLYLTPKNHDNWTLATRVESGVIDGAERDEVPADSRLYGGGASSVRGYDYQSIGEREGDTPLGGTERVTGSFEVRYRTKGAMGGVLFYDTGYIGGGENEDDSFRSSLGVGFRYFTPMGPLRADVAFPLDKRDGVDQDAQLYVSIGQFF